jgi:hypothetical protein
MEVPMRRMNKQEESKGKSGGSAKGAQGRRFSLEEKKHALTLIAPLFTPPLFTLREIFFSSQHFIWKLLPRFSD